MARHISMFITAPFVEEHAKRVSDAFVERQRARRRSQPRTRSAPAPPLPAPPKAPGSSGSMANGWGQPGDLAEDGEDLLGCGGMLC